MMAAHSTRDVLADWLTDKLLTGAGRECDPDSLIQANKPRSARRPAASARQYDAPRRLPHRDPLDDLQRPHVDYRHVVGRAVGRVERPPVAANADAPRSF